MFTIPFYVPEERGKEEFGTYAERMRVAEEEFQKRLKDAIQYGDNHAK